MTPDLDFSDCVPSPFNPGDRIRLINDRQVRGEVMTLLMSAGAGLSHGFSFRLDEPHQNGHPLAGHYREGEVYSRSWYPHGGFEKDVDPTGEVRRQEEFSQVSLAGTGEQEIMRLRAEVLELRSLLDRPKPITLNQPTPGTIAHAIKMYKEQGTPQLVKTLVDLIADYHCPRCGKAMQVEFEA